MDSIVIEYNCETGETIERAMTPEEILEIQTAAEKAKLEDEARAAEEQAKAEAKAAALAKLTALGLTEEEAKAIAG